MSKEILIVDDEPGVVVAIQFLMEKQGHNVLVAQRGEDALELIYKYKPDLVILDIMLPGISGWEVCEIIRLNPAYRNVKIIFERFLVRVLTRNDNFFLSLKSNQTQIKTDNKIIP